MDGDGFGDVLVGDGGKVYLRRGSATKLGIPQTVVNPDDPKGNSVDMGFGDSLAAVGDLDGDGQDDVAIGIPQHSTAVAGGLGRVYVLESLPPIADGGVDSGSGGSSSGGSSSGGSGAKGGGGSGAGGKAGAPGGSSGDSGGCGCRVAERSGGALDWSIVALVGLALVRRRVVRT